MHFSHAGCSSEIPQIPGCRRTPVTRSLNNSPVHVSGISDVICNDRAPPCQVLCHRLPEYICCKGFVFNFVPKRTHAKYNGTRQDTVYLHYMFIYNDEFQNKKKMKGVAHLQCSMLTMRFWAKAQTDNRRLPVPCCCYGALQAHSQSHLGNE